ncbi:hypothetical protein SPI_04349 [Niveomyces insectorum RCEF 264]|uniref:Uncharacterized protein n=1 Tax=Niveomyces insectorum RCEF 264 TaxID=1081102 RepID=A0A167VN79_9HYPO|nr:hypothetical protein SPI_04349 [Niveomyces insectorum RCEF 264]
MSDDMCGPSNALKGFTKLVSKDQSAHQDRIAAGHGKENIQTFRSTQAGLSNEADVQNFVTSGPAAMPAVAPNGFQAPGPGPFQQMGPQHQLGRPFASQSFALVPIVNGRVAAPAGSNWAAEFAATHGTTVQNGGGPPVLMTGSNVVRIPPPQGVPQSVHFPPRFAPGSVAPMGPSSILRESRHDSPVSQGCGLQGGVANLDEEALEARFAQLETDADFKHEMDAWMAKHGPKEAGQGRRVAAWEQNVDAVLEQMAKDLEAQKLANARVGENEVLATSAAPVASKSDENFPTMEKSADKVSPDEGDELARTAGQIAHTLDAHPGQQFQNSAFAALMRQMEAKKVVVKDNELVDENTGRPVQTSADTARGEEYDKHSADANAPPSQHEDASGWLRRSASRRGHHGAKPSAASPGKYPQVSASDTNKQRHGNLQKRRAASGTAKRTVSGHQKHISSNENSARDVTTDTTSDHSISSLCEASSEEEPRGRCRAVTANNKSLSTIPESP